MGKYILDLFSIEKSMRLGGYDLICGVDEAGRGPLAGPVVACAVIMPADSMICKINDSKKLTSKMREGLFYIIRKEAIAYGVGIVSHEIIDKINIRNATHKAMEIAVSKLKVKPDYIFVDGNFTPFDSKISEAVVKGDSKCYNIAAASILAKVLRDKIMVCYDKIYPEYGFSKHMGYSTKMHMDKIREIGRCPIHRKSFKLKEEKAEQLKFKM